MVQTVTPESQKPRLPNHNYLPLAHWWERLFDDHRLVICLVSDVDVGNGTRAWCKISRSDQKRIISQFREAEALKTFIHYCRQAAVNGDML